MPQADASQEQTMSIVDGSVFPLFKQGCFTARPVINAQVQFKDDAVDSENSQWTIEYRYKF